MDQEDRQEQVLEEVLLMEEVMEEEDLLTSDIIQTLLQLLTIIHHTTLITDLVLMMMFDHQLDQQELQVLCLNNHLLNSQPTITAMQVRLSLFFYTQTSFRIHVCFSLDQIFSWGSPYFLLIIPLL